MIHADHRKAILSATLFFVLFVSVLAISTIVPPSWNTSTSDRIIVAKLMGNDTQNTCTQTYNWSCQNYERQTIVGSTFLSTIKNVKGTFPGKKRLIWQNVSLFRAYDMYFQYGKIYMGELSRNLKHSFFPSRRVYKPVKFKEITTPFTGVTECQDVINQLNRWVKDSHIEVITLCSFFRFSLLSMIL